MNCRYDLVTHVGPEYTPMSCPRPELMFHGGGPTHVSQRMLLNAVLMRDTLWRVLRGSFVHNLDWDFVMKVEDAEQVHNSTNLVSTKFKGRLCRG